jgi:hypothetical protein
MLFSGNSNGRGGGMLFCNIFYAVANLRATSRHYAVSE